MTSAAIKSEYQQREYRESLAKFRNISSEELTRYIQKYEQKSPLAKLALDIFTYTPIRIVAARSVLERRGLNGKLNF